MHTLKMFWACTLLIACVCVCVSLSANIQINSRDSLCKKIPFSASPVKTMYPKKGEILVSRGRTLQQEAANNVLLRKTLDYAIKSPTYRNSVEPYAARMGLNGNESLAIFSYTLGDFSPALHEKFNEALRHGNDFAYPVFHYWLDSGLRKLLKKQGSQRGYHYRGNSIYFTFRQNTTTFPGFTSTSKDFHVAREGFWSEGCTMMKITTHLGADITRLSNYTKEKEVLFPPYERFVVKGYTYENGMPTVTLETVEPVVRGTLGYSNTGSHVSGLSVASCVLLSITLFVLY